MSLHRILAAAALAAFALFAVAAPPVALATEASLAVQTMNVNGLDVSLSAANAGGNYFSNPNDERTFVFCSNTNGSTRTVTAVAQHATVAVPGYGTVTLTDQASVVPLTSGLTLIGPFPASYFNDATGLVHLTYDAVTGLTCGVVRMPRSVG